MRTTSRTRLFIAASATAAGLSFVSSALAQGGGVLNPGGGNTQTGPAINTTTAAPQPHFNKQYPVWFGIAVIVALVGGVMTVSLIPSKRSHLD